MTPEPPKGYRILSPTYLADHPLPGDAIYWAESVESWDESVFQGRMIPALTENPYTYATADKSLPESAFAEPDLPKSTDCNASP